MDIYTLCYSGTDCWLDQALVLREPKELNSYNVYSGYIPSKTYNLLAAQDQKAPQPKRSCTTMNGCGGPYDKSHESLPVRLWDIHQERDEDGFLISEWTECSLAPSFLNDSLSGASVEIVAIAGIAEMLGVTLHLVGTGMLDEIKEKWSQDHAMGYTEKALEYPKKDNGMWNNSVPATAGAYCLRWSEADNERIKTFKDRFDRVLLLGHSRGGVACIIASNYIAEWFDFLTLKIIALDPVPGTGEWWPVLTHVPAMKEMEYIGIYAIDETSSGFNGVVPRVKGFDQSRKAGEWDPLSPTSTADFAHWNPTNYKLIYTRGRHATVPGSRSEYGQGEADAVSDAVGSSGNLTAAYVFATAHNWGVPLTPPDSTTIMGWKTTMNQTRAHFATMRNYNYGPKSALGKLNGWFFYNARGISSTNGSNPGKWNYLEAFIKHSSDESVNSQRGLISQGIRAKYYPDLGGTGTVHPWTYLADAM